MMKSIVALCVLASANVHAAGWKSAVWAGLNHGPTTKGTVTIGGTPVDVTVDSKSAFNFGLEYFRDTDSHINLATMMENTWIASKSNLPSTFVTSILVGPRFDTKTAINVWAEIGVGPALSVLGSKSATIDGLTYTYDSGTIFSFAISPRIGVDIPIGSSYFLGVQAAYFTSAYTSSGRISSGSASVAFTEDARTSLFTTAVRFGRSLGDDAPAAPAAPSEPVPAMSSIPEVEPSPTPEPASGKLDAEELLKLKKLRDAGVLTEKEYQERKAKLLK